MSDASAGGSTGTSTVPGTGGRPATGGTTGTNTGAGGARNDAGASSGGRDGSADASTSTGGAGGRATGGNATGGRAGGAGGSSSSGTAGQTSGTGGKSTGGTGGSQGTGGSGRGGATGSGGQAGSTGNTTPGNPFGSCSDGVPAAGKLVDTSSPTTVVGDGSEEGCTFAQLQSAVTKGGIITFECGGDATIPVEATLKLPTNKDTVIDGGGRITLDGGKSVQIFRFDGTNFAANDKRVTLQRITIANGKTTPEERIPNAPSPCSQGWNDGEGGALYMRDGNLTIIDSIFRDNEGAPVGPDTGGGAIYVVGSKAGVLVVGSTFTNNRASNGAGVGCLFADLRVYNSLFTNNNATGNGGNGDDPDSCDVINNDQHQVGSGGNGGALYSDGTGRNVVLCGNAIMDNKAGESAFGAGLFFTSNDMSGTLTITDTTITGNTGRSWTIVTEGDVDNAGTAVGTNCKSITLVNSTLQGVP